MGGGGDLQDHRSPKSSNTPLSALRGNGIQLHNRFTLGVSCLLPRSVSSLLNRTETTITELHNDSIFSPIKEIEKRDFKMPVAGDAHRAKQTWSSGFFVLSIENINYC